MNVNEYAVAALEAARQSNSTPQHPPRPGPYFRAIPGLQSGARLFGHTAAMRLAHWDGMFWRSFTTPSSEWGSIHEAVRYACATTRGRSEHQQPAAFAKVPGWDYEADRWNPAHPVAQRSITSWVFDPDAAGHDSHSGGRFLPADTFSMGDIVEVDTGEICIVGYDKRLTIIEPKTNNKTPRRGDHWNHNAGKKCRLVNLEVTR